jgi:biopolymer transport protein ExbB/TolQ
MDYLVKALKQMERETKEMTDKIMESVQIIEARNSLTLAMFENTLKEHNQVVEQNQAAMKSVINQEDKINVQI